MTEKIVVKVDQDLEDLIPLFISTREKDMAGLATGLAAGDFTALRMIGHSMKGAGGAYGFDPVSTIGGVIETAALASDAATIAAQLAALRDYLARIEIKYV